jgi:hypothetical protein
VHQLVCFDAGGSSGQQQLGAARAPVSRVGAAKGVGKESRGWRWAPTGSRVGGGDDGRWEAESRAAPVTATADERVTTATATWRQISAA